MKKSQVVFLFIFLVGCSKNQTFFPTTPMIVPISSPISMNTNEPPTKAPLPSATLPPTETITSVETPLTIEESQIEIEKMMQESSDCLFPCWWGIVPGTTSWINTIGILTHLNLKWTSIGLPEGDGKGVVFAKDGNYVYGTVGFTVVDTIIQDINIHGVEAHDPVFTKRWEYYTFTEIFKTYGQPSQIWVIMVDDGLGKAYHLLLFYDELKALIRYSGYSISDVMCPDFSKGEVDWLDIYLQSPDRSRKLMDITNVSKIIELLDEPDVYRVEKMTGERINELYKLFTESKEPACFQGVYQ